MHSDPEAVRKTIRTYVMVGVSLLVFTGITVAANQLHLAVPAAVAVALVIATMKGSMVASIFMHLTHEKKWIYGALLLTVVGFIILMTVPIFTIMDNIGTPGSAVSVSQPAHPEH
jgi:caa(3)-type oxidase subunit IV